MDHEYDEGVCNASSCSFCLHITFSIGSIDSNYHSLLLAMTKLLLLRLPNKMCWYISFILISFLSISCQTVGASNSISKQTRSFVLDCKPLKEETWDGLMDFIASSSGFADVCPFEISGPEACPTPSSMNTNNQEGYVVTSDSDLYLSCDPYQLSNDSKCIIDCPSLPRHFTVKSGGSLTIENFVLRHATETSVRVEQGGRLSVFGSTFEDNTNEVDGGSGGAIFSGPNSFLEVRYTDFRHNRASTGGAIYIVSDEGSTGEDGNSNMRIFDCAFSNNVASNAGGAIASKGTDGSGSSILVVNSCTFDNNEADVGGAIYVTDSLSSSLSVSYSHFSNNMALYGGAIDYSNGSTDISDSTFTRNYAFNWGGAINAGDRGSATIRRNIFSSNGARNNGPAINDRNRSQIIVRDNYGCGNTVDQGRQCDGVLIWLSPRRLLCRSFVFECTVSPTSQPSLSPSEPPSASPSRFPSGSPSRSYFPSSTPTISPSVSNAPSTKPSLIPSDTPSLVPSSGPSPETSGRPSLSTTPTTKPILTLSSSPSAVPSIAVSDIPTFEPSLGPSMRGVIERDNDLDGSKSIGSSSNSELPSDLPSLVPSQIPSDFPSLVPSQVSSDSPHLVPTTNNNNNTNKSS